MEITGISEEMDSMDVDDERYALILFLHTYYILYMFLCLCFMTTWNLDTILSPSFDYPSKWSWSGIILDENIYVLRSIL